MVRIAAPATAPDLDAEVHPSFGHCDGYLLLDTDNGHWEAIARPDGLVGDCTGAAAACALVAAAVQVVLAGEIGEEAARVFREAGVLLFNGVAGRVRDAIDRLLSDELSVGPPPHPCVSCAAAPQADLSDAQRALISQVSHLFDRPRTPAPQPTDPLQPEWKQVVIEVTRRVMERLAEMDSAGEAGAGQAQLDLVAPGQVFRRPSFLPSGLAIAVASGKGGTGKTTVAVNLGLALGARAQLLDCDVEDPNAHLLLLPRIVGGQKVEWPAPVVDTGLCDGCVACAEACRFHALAVVKGQVLVFPNLCRGCGVCAIVCPREAIREQGREIGAIRWGEVRGLRYAGGELGVGEEMSGPVIRAVKERAVPGRVAIVDCPPGSSAPMIEAVAGCDYCLLVTEPTAFGLNDLRLAVAVLRRLDLPMGVVINRATEDGDGGVADYCQSEGIPILLEIPDSRRIAELYSRGIPFVDEMPEWRPRLLELFEVISSKVQATAPSLAASGD